MTGKKGKNMKERYRVQNLVTKGKASMYTKMGTVDEAIRWAGL